LKRIRAVVLGIIFFLLKHSYSSGRAIAPEEDIPRSIRWSKIASDARAASSMMAVFTPRIRAWQNLSASDNSAAIICNSRLTRAKVSSSDLAAADEVGDDEFVMFVYALAAAPFDFEQHRRDAREIVEVDEAKTAIGLKHH
jgi:hypothetical protein